MAFTLASVVCAASGTLWQFTVARVLQGAGGAMMVPVGRLIVLRNTEKQHLVRMIAYLTWPALTAPVIGPPLGGLITTYSSWPWIFLLNVPLGLIGLALAQILIPNTRGERRGAFDWLGFALTGFASFSLMYALEAIGRRNTDWRFAVPLLVLSVAAGLYAVRHARRRAHPLLDLTPFGVPSFAITVSGSVAVRAAITAAPFLLPLMFQLAFGLSPLNSGLFLLAVFAGNLGMKPATNAVLGRFGFRRTLIWNGVLAMVTIFACGLLTAATPTLIIVAVLFVSGLSRSMEFTTINALSFCDLDQARMSGANTLFSMLQQMGNALGVAGGAILLRAAATLTHPGEPGGHGKRLPLRLLGARPDRPRRHLAFSPRSRPTWARCCGRKRVKPGRWESLLAGASRASPLARCRGCARPLSPRKEAVGRGACVFSRRGAGDASVPSPHGVLHAVGRGLG